jgi:hypothetical protein
LESGHFDMCQIRFPEFKPQKNTKNEEDVMRLLREFMAKLAKAKEAPPRKVSRYMCEACEMKGYCGMSAEERQRRRCWETRAMRPR